MSDCARFDPLVTPYVDGELADPDRGALDRHLAACPSCRSRVDAERIMHGVLHSHRPRLCAVTAPPALRARCEPARMVPAAAAAGWRMRRQPVALAATLVLALAAAFIYRVTQAPVSLMAAELATDHVKCFLLHGSPDHVPDAAEVEQSLEQTFGWDATLPAQPEQAGLTLVGARPCVYAEGRVAHILYRYQGRPVSLFMLPDRQRAEALVDVMGHHAVIWNAAGRTFVLVAREPPQEMDRLARFVHAGLR